jgi:hypothetical protein
VAWWIYSSLFLKMKKLFSIIREKLCSVGWYYKPQQTEQDIRAEREGWIANLSAKTIAVNPYNLGSSEANSWVSGWNQADDFCKTPRLLDRI